MAGFFANLAGILVPLALEEGLAHKAKSQADIISIMLIAGAGENDLGGNVPHVALWDDNGNRIGQYAPESSETIAVGDTGPVINITPTQNGGHQADPYYVMLSTEGNNAICLAAITVANQKISATVYGDTGKMCGQSWYPSSNSIGADFAKPKCVWLDNNHSYGINAKAMSFHLNDMSGDNADLINEYNDDPDTLCSSSPRYSFWGNLLPNSEIPIFDPPLQYNPSTNGSNGQGADVDPSLVIDQPGQYNKSVYFYQGLHESNKRATRLSHRRGNAQPLIANVTKVQPPIAKNNATSGNRTSSNPNPSHLVVTSHPSDDVREVCEHPNSYGWDIVSTIDNLYCDMEYRVIYNVCAGAVNNATCFDLDTKQILLPTAKVTTRDVSKNYTSFSYWTV